MPDTLPTYLTKAEAAQIARVTPRTITNWIERGWLRAGGTPAHVLIKPEWLQETIERDRRGEQP